MKKLTTLTLVLICLLNSNAQNTIPTVGNVGIGTLNPEARLNITSTSSIAGTNLTNSSILIGTSERGLGIDTNEILTKELDLVLGTLSENKSVSFKAGGNRTRMVVSGTNGYVGIGTNRPEAKLNITNSSTIAGTNLANSSILLGTPQKGLGIDSNEILTKGIDLVLGTLSEDRDLYIKVGGNRTRMFIDGTNGHVGIGTNNPQNELSVDGAIWAQEVKISLDDAADWVFEDDYNLRPLEEVEHFIKKNKHLPEIPSAEEFRKNDLKVSEMSNKLLQKVEELTLYTIEQDKRIKALEERLAMEK